MRIDLDRPLDAAWMTGRTALVTGGGGRAGGPGTVGWAIARLLARHGAAVAVLDRDAVAAHRTVSQIRAAVPAMRRRRWGRIIHISSMAGVIGAPRSSPYSASKAGIIGLTRALAMDVAGWGVTVNAICPGALDTSRSVLSLDPDLDVRAEIRQRGRRLPVGRVGRPEDVAAAVRYLAGDGAEFVTGQMLVLDGGGPAPFPLPRPQEEPA